MFNFHRSNHRVFFTEWFSDQPRWGKKKLKKIKNHSRLKVWEISRWFCRSQVRLDHEMRTVTETWCCTYLPGSSCQGFPVFDLHAQIPCDIAVNSRHQWILLVISFLYPILSYLFTNECSYRQIGSESNGNHSLAQWEEKQKIRSFFSYLSF